MLKCKCQLQTHQPNKVSKHPSTHTSCLNKHPSTHTSCLSKHPSTHTSCLSKHSRLHTNTKVIIICLLHLYIRVRWRSTSHYAPSLAVSSTPQHCLSTVLASNLSYTEKHIITIYAHCVTIDKHCTSTYGTTYTHINVIETCCYVCSFPTIDNTANSR